MVCLPTEVTEYGCVRCQTWHRQGDPLYLPHLLAQSRHGPRVRLVRRDSHGREYVPVRRPKDNSVVWV